jgi:hypothetical protein
MTVILRIVRGTVVTALTGAVLTSAALAVTARPAGAQGIPLVTSAKAAANKAAAASNAQTAAMQNTSAASPANTAKPSTTTTSVTSVRTTTVTGFSAAAPQAPQQHQQTKAVASQPSTSAMKPVVSVGSSPAHASVSATATVVPAGKAMPAVAGKAGVATTGPLSDSAGKSISVTQRGTRGEVSLNREVYSYDAGARRDPFVSLMRSGELRPMLSDLRLVTVLYDPTGRNSIAVMHDLSTKDQYRVRVGQTLGRMRVAQIQPKQVVFTVEEVGFSRQEALALGDTNKARMQ